MRARQTLVCVLSGVFLSAGILAGATASGEKPPTAVSPGASQGAGVAIADRCPTFSWGGVEDARSYELTVYRVGDDGLEARPVFTETIPATARSWTPSLARCLEAGGAYAWSVRASHDEAPSNWSEPSLFRISAGADREARGPRSDLGVLVAAETAKAAGDDAGEDTAEGTAPVSWLRKSLPRQAPVVAPTQLTVDGGVAATSFTGDGSTLTGLNPANLAAGTAAIDISGAAATAGDAGTVDGFDAAATATPNTLLALDGSGKLPADITGNAATAASAATATALAADGGECAAGEFAAGVDASGAATGCAVPADAHAFATNGTRVGSGALAANTTGNGNTASGNRALTANTTGSYNTAHGYYALRTNTLGTGNTASGVSALRFNTEGLANVAFGLGALRGNTTGNQNTACGTNVLRDSTTGSNNTGTGYFALRSSTGGADNTANGSFSLRHNQGDRNTAVGHRAGYYATTGNDNIFIGGGAEGTAGESNTIRIGGAVVGTAANQQNRTFINGILGVTTGVDDAVTVMIDSAGQLGTVSSSQRFKEDIQDMEAASDGLLSLRPVTFRYRREFADGEKPVQFGLIAEEVAEVFPELVVYDGERRPETVKYHLLSSLLLNELQKLHSRSIEQTQTVTDQAQEIEQLRSQADRLVAVEAHLRELEPLAARLERLEALLTKSPRLTAGDRRPPPDERPGER